MTNFELELLGKLITQYQQETQQAPTMPQQAPTMPQQAPTMPQQAPTMPQQAPTMPQQAPTMPQQTDIESSLRLLSSMGYSVTHPQNQFDVLRQQIDNLRQTVIRNNMQTMQAAPTPQSADDIIASIINPPLPDFGMEPNGGVIKNGK